MQRRLIFVSPLIIAALFGAQAQAETVAEKPVEVWASPGIYSHHFNRGKDLREDNIGPGVEVMLADDHLLMAGSFINSNRARTHYAAYQWRPLHWQVAGARVSAGVVAGVFDGYPNYRNGGAFAVAMPLLAVEGGRFGVNFALIPTIANRLDGAIAIQVKLRVW